MGEQTTAQIGSQLLLDEAGRGLLPASRASEERFEVLADDLVEQGSLGLVALILHGVQPSRDRVLPGDRSKFGADSRFVRAPVTGPLLFDEVVR